LLARVADLVIISLDIALATSSELCNIPGSVESLTAIERRDARTADNPVLQNLIAKRQDLKLLRPEPTALALTSRTIFSGVSWSTIRAV
jgi:hypothetical protein